MKTSRIDVNKSEGEGLVLGAKVSITQTGTIKGLETYEMMDFPIATDKDAKKKKEPPKVTINLEVEKTEISKVSASKKTSKEAFDEEWDKKKEK